MENHTPNQFKFKIYLNKYQKLLIEKHFICSRIIFNATVKAYQSAANSKSNQLPIFFQKWLVNSIKKNPAWANHTHVSKECINGARRRAVSEINNIPNSDYSGLIRKDAPLTFSIYQNFSVSIEDCAIYIPRFKDPIWGKFDHLKGINLCINHLHFSKEENKYFVRLIQTSKNI